jgi:hypothetical protein
LDAAINPLTSRNRDECVLPSQETRPHRNAKFLAANTRRACAHSILALDQRVARAPDGATSAPRVGSHKDKALGDLADRTETDPSPPAPTARIRAARIKPTQKRLDTVIHEGGHKAPKLVLHCCCMKRFRLPHFLRWLLCHQGILPKLAFRLHCTPGHICWRNHTHLASRHAGPLTRRHLLGQRDRPDPARLVRP